MSTSDPLPLAPKPLQTGPASHHNQQAIQAMAVAQERYRKAYQDAKEKALTGAIDLLTKSQTVRQSVPINEADVLMSSYGPRPVRFVEGNGAWLLGTDGAVYLDCLSGIAVTNLGHNHPEVTKAVVTQAQQLMHVSNLFGTEPHLLVAHMLQELTGWADAKTFFCNSGAEANEGAIKLAKKYGHDQHPDKVNVVAFSDSFHGRTMGTLQVTSNPAYREPFGPFGDWATIVPRDDIEALRAAVTDHTCAIIVEVIQGEAGVLPIPREMLVEARALCDQHDALLIIDEVQTGVGRTGRWFGWQGTDVVPDVITLAKGLANGLPIGAVVAHGEAANVFTPGNHATTFGGNPVAARAAMAVLTTMRDEQLLGQCRDRGKQLREGLLERAIPGVVDVRGEGLLLGIELSEPIGQSVVNNALHNHLVINAPRPNVVRLAPPFIITKKEVKEAINRLDVSIRTAYETHLQGQA